MAADQLPTPLQPIKTGDEIQLDLDLQGFKNGAQTLSRRVLLTPIEVETLFFRVTLVSGCVNRNDCGPTESCGVRVSRTPSIRGNCRFRQSRSADRCVLEGRCC